MTQQGSRGSAAYVLASVALFILSAFPAGAQVLDIIEVAPGVHMLQGPTVTGNVGVASGAERTMIIDDSFPFFTTAIEAAIATFTPNPVSFVLNTHYHRDHTGGNENFAGTGALIIAHDNTRQRLTAAGLIEFLGSVETGMMDSSLPVVTFDVTTTLHVNGEEIHAFHVANAHTDGDAIVHFRNANVFHMGDIYFNGFFPYIDTDAGGTLSGLIAAVDQVLAVADDATMIIPGHGDLSDKAGLQDYRDMLDVVAERVAIAIAEGRTLEDMKALRPTANFDAAWADGEVSADQFVEMAYRSLRAPR